MGRRQASRFQWFRRCPDGLTLEYFTTKYGVNAAAIRPKRGWDTVTVRGAVAAWAELHEKFGKLSFSEVIEPAAELVNMVSEWYRSWLASGAQPSQRCRDNAVSIMPSCHVDKRLT